MDRGRKITVNLPDLVGEDVGPVGKRLLEEWEEVYERSGLAGCESIDIGGGERLDPGSDWAFVKDVGRGAG